MIVLINDANILIDLLKVELLDEFVKLEYEMCVPDLVTSEVHESNVSILQSYFENNTLIQNSFTYQELTEIQLLEITHGSLSVPDCSCLYLAKKKSATLLTGDARLRNVAASEKIEVHGILWVIDQLLEKEIVTYSIAHDKLKELVDLNCRLPQEECKKRITAWKKKI